MNKKLQEQLVEKAAEAAKKSYAPYSNFHVGAALLVAGKPACNLAVAPGIAGRPLIITGGNVENASFGLTICAERTALAAAVSAGHRRFEAIAVAAGGKETVVPCGACLQVLAEFCGPDLIVIAVSAARPDKVKIFKLRDLLPRVFKFRS